jgi:elongation of very long chain fatty acids protein 6
MLYPKNFTFQNGVDFLNTYRNVWVYSLLFYLPICQLLENYKAQSVNSKIFLRKLSIFWNILVAIFSIIGTTQTLPALIKCISHNGIDSTLHYEHENSLSIYSCDYRLNAQTSYWCFLFACSKIPEFIDTFLYVIRNGKQHIFLHWYHHIFTAFYSYWLVVQPPEPSRYGLWMTAINFFVHSFMYSYYALTEFEVVRKSQFMKIFAKFITSIQIGQMFLIMSVLIHASATLGYEFEHFGFAMYGVYAVLFLNLFLKKYIRNRDQESFKIYDLKPKIKI